jgi:hypothetical protein
MTPETFPFLLQTLLRQVPLLLIYGAGAVGAAFLLGRHRAPALVCLAGCAVGILTILILSGAEAWVLAARMREGWTAMRYGQAMSVVGLVGAVLRPLGLALVMAAVFIGRKGPA